MTLHKEKNVSEMMTTKLIVIKKNDDIDKVIALMVDNNINQLPVVEGNKAIGLVSDKDVRLAFACDPFINNDGENSVDLFQQSTKVFQVMRKDFITVAPSDTISKCARLLYEDKNIALLVSKNDELVGIVTVYDLLKELF